jgi:hypothetical protein
MRLPMSKLITAKWTGGVAQRVYLQPEKSDLGKCLDWLEGKFDFYGSSLIS